MRSPRSVLLVLLLGAGCERGQLLVHVRSTMQQIDGYELRVEQHQREVRERWLRQPELLEESLGVAPGAEAEGSVRLTLIGRTGSEMRARSTRLLPAFDPGEVLDVYLCLASRCVGRAGAAVCAPEEECAPAGCVPAVERVAGQEGPEWCAPGAGGEPLGAPEAEPVDVPGASTAQAGEWALQAFSGGALQLAALLSDGTGGIYLGGTYSGELVLDGGALASREQDAFVARLDDAGRLRWLVRLEGPGDQLLSALALGPEGLAAGGSYGGELQAGGTQLGYPDLPPKPRAFVLLLDPGSGAVLAARDLRAQSRVQALAAGATGLLVAGIAEEELDAPDCPQQSSAVGDNEEAFFLRLSMPDLGCAALRGLGDVELRLTPTAALAAPGPPDRFYVAGTYHGISGPLPPSLFSDVFALALDGQNLELLAQARVGSELNDDGPQALALDERGDLVLPVGLHGELVTVGRSLGAEAQSVFGVVLDPNLAGEVARWVAVRGSGALVLGRSAQRLGNGEVVVGGEVLGAASIAGVALGSGTAGRADLFWYRPLASRPVRWLASPGDEHLEAMAGDGEFLLVGGAFDQGIDLAGARLRVPAPWDGFVARLRW